MPEAMYAQGSTMASASDSPSTNSAPRRDLSADIRTTGTQLVITNRDSFDWQNCIIQVNGRWETRGSIAAGARAETGLATFTRSDGERFNPFTHKVESANIRCDTQHGRLSFYGAFR